MLSTKQSRVSSIAGVVLTLLLFEPAQAVVMPVEICTVNSAIFRAAGCIGNENPLCQLLGFQLQFKLGPEPLCIERPCTGYSQEDTHECRGLLECPLDRIFLLGVCNGFDICCRKSSVDASVDANALDQVGEYLSRAHKTQETRG